MTITGTTVCITLDIPACPRPRQFSSTSRGQCYLPQFIIYPPNSTGNMSGKGKTICLLRQPPSRATCPLLTRDPPPPPFRPIKLGTGNQITPLLVLPERITTPPPTPSTIHQR